MFRKLTLALAATAAVGTAALAPSTAEATWWGHGYYGKYYGDYYGPRFGYGPRFYHKRFFYGSRFHFRKFGGRGYRYY